MHTESQRRKYSFPKRWALAACAWAFAEALSAGELRVLVRNSSEQLVADAVVIAVPVDGAPRTAAKHAKTAAMDQVDKQFNPFVLAIEAGTDVEFPNHDQVHHHVYSFSPAKRFELPLYSSAQKNSVRFDQPGIVVIGCNIHDWMIGYIYVAETPYFARTDASGGATLSDLPGGTYKVRIWHPRMKQTERDSERAVDIGSNAVVEQGWQIALATPAPQRRAPLPGGHGY